MADQPRLARMTGHRGAGADEPRQVVGRLKEATKTRTDAELAAFLNVSKGAIANWRKDGVPPKHLLEVSRSSGIPTEWFERGSMYPGGLRAMRADAIANSLIRAGLMPDQADQVAKEHGTVLLGLALVEAERDYRAEHPGKSFRASQLAAKVITILVRNCHLYVSAIRNNMNHDYLTSGLKHSLGLPEDWTPDDPW